MATSRRAAPDDTVRELLLLMPRLVGRAKRIPVPDELRALALTPRHLSLLSYLLFDGALTVSELAQRLGIATTTASLVITDLVDKDVLVRTADAQDRRRRLVDIAPRRRAAIRRWLAPGAQAWQHALAPLTARQREQFVATLRAYEAAVARRER